MAAKLGYEAIEFAVRKFLTKNTKGIASIPGQKMKDKIKILVDKYAKQIRATGQDVNNVTVKQVDNAIDYGMALKKQKVKKAQVLRDKAKKEYDYVTSEKYIEDLWNKSPAEIRELMRKQGLTPVEDKGIKSLGKKDPFQGWTPKIVPKDKTLLKDSPEAIAKIKAENKAAAERLRAKKEIDLSKYTDDDLNVLVKEHQRVSAEAKRLGDAGEHYEKFKNLNKRREEIEKILDAAQAVPESGYGSIKADLALQKQKKYERLVKAEEEKAAKDPNYIPDIIDPEDFASGGIARVGYFKGGKVWKEFIEGLFIKTSNDIRLGKGKWAGLTQEQWIKQHDDLTQMLKKWEQGGKKRLPPGAEQYIGMNDLQISRAIKEAEAKATRLGIKGPHWKEQEIRAQMDEKKEELIKNLTHDFKGKPYKDVAQTIEGTVIDERTILKTKYPGISDDLLNKILIDDNPQRIAEVKATMDEFLKLREVGKSEQEAFDIITKSFKKIPTKHAEGGIAGQLHLNQGGRVSFTKGGKVSSGLAHVLGV